MYYGGVWASSSTSNLLIYGVYVVAACDGVRPICGFCTKRGLSPCVFLGSMTRVDEELAERNLVEVKLRKHQRTHQLHRQPQSGTSNDRNPNIPSNESTASDPAAAAVTVPPPSVAPEGGPSLLVREKLAHESVADDLEFLRLSGLSLDSDLAGSLSRPGAPAEEEMELCKIYFTFRHTPGLFVHMRSFFKSFSTIDPFLLYAL
ncbi:hypothetical protein HK405_006103 [Cladochytrium tenue]|nr:hypothetical protein HK405_006103 [Cladochytrium tenue]